MLENLGGTGDVMESPLGARFDFCDNRNGWIFEARKNYLHMRNIASFYTFSSNQRW